MIDSWSEPFLQVVLSEASQRINNLSKAFWNISLQTHMHKESDKEKETEIQRQRKKVSDSLRRFYSSLYWQRLDLLVHVKSIKERHYSENCCAWDCFSGARSWKVYEKVITFGTGNGRNMAAVLGVPPFQNFPCPPQSSAVTRESICRVCNWRPPC